MRTSALGLRRRRQEKLSPSWIEGYDHRGYLVDATHPMLLESIDFYKPVMSVAVEPLTNQDQDKLVESLEKLSEEDPTFHVTLDEDTGQTIISGMGELHLDVLCIGF